MLLFTIGGMARLERLPDKPIQEIVVALAGPAVNVIIAIVLFLVMQGTLATADFLHPDMVRGSLIFKLFAANVILVLFNLIPAFPMDGGRVLRAALATYMSRVRATVVAARVGQGIAVLLGVFGLFTSQPILLLIAIFVFLAARQEMQYTVLKQAAENLCVGQVMVTRFLALPFDLSVGAAAEEISKDSSHEYPLVDGQLHLRGMAFRQQILEASRTSPSRAVLEVGFHPPAIQAETPFLEAFELMQCHQVAVLPIINPEKQIVGMVSLARLSAFVDAASSAASRRGVKNP